jgi:hypothetical protein
MLELETRQNNLSGGPYTVNDGYIDKLYHQELNGLASGSNRENEILEKGLNSQVEKKDSIAEDNQGSTNSSGEGRSSLGDSSSGKGGFLKNKTKKGRKIMLIGSLIGSIGGIFGAITFLPQAVSQWVNGRTSQYVQYYQDRIGEKIFAGYLKDQVGRIRSCGGGGYSNMPGSRFGSRTIPCNVTSGKGGWLRRTYDNYNANQMDEALRRNGFAYEYDPDGRGGAGGINILDNNGSPISGLNDIDWNNIGGALDLGPRGASRITKAAMRQAARDQTKSWEFFKRRRMIGAAQRRFGIQGCIFFCDTRDKLTYKFDARLKGFNRFKARIASNVVGTVLGDSMGLIAGCLVGPDDCTSDKFRDNHRSTMASYLQKAIGRGLTPDEAAKKLTNVLEVLQRANAEGIGIGRTAVKLVLEKFISQQAAEQALKAATVVGIVFAIGSIIRQVSAGINILPKVMSERNMQTLATVYSTYEVMIGESKRMGYMSLQEYGEMSTSMLGLQNSRIFRSEILGQDASQITSQPYKCSSEEAVKLTGMEGLTNEISGLMGEIITNVDPNMSVGEMTCDSYTARPDVALSGNGFIGGLNKIVNGGPIGTLFNAVDWTMSKISGYGIKAVNFLCFGCADKIMEEVSKQLEPIMLALANGMFPSIVSSTMGDGSANLMAVLRKKEGAKLEGARIFDGMFGGAEVEYDFMLGRNLGGMQLGDISKLELDNAIAEMNYYDMQVASLGDRLWSLNGESSLLTYAILGSHGNTSMANLFNPIKNLQMAFSPINQKFIPNTYASSYGPSPFKITKYGFTKQQLDSITIEDIEAYDPVDCKAKKEARTAKLKEIEEDNQNNLAGEGEIDYNGQAKPRSIEKCMLIEAMTDSYSTIYLEDDEVDYLEE